jgi:ATP-dependent DNA helicase RecG
VTDLAPRPLRRLAEVPVTALKYVKDKRAASLAQMGIETVFDLLTTYPRRYVDRTAQIDVSDLTVGDEVAIFAEVRRCTSRRTAQGKTMVTASVSDGTGTLNVVFFNQPWRERQLQSGVMALFFGKVGEYRGERQMSNPVVDIIVGARGEERDPSRVGRVVPIYPASGKAGLTSWEMGGFIEESLRRAPQILDTVPESIRTRYGLIDRTTALHQIHLPEELSQVRPARRRLVFDEFLRLQILLTLRRRRAERDAVGISHALRDEDLDTAPGALTSAESSLVQQFLAGHRFALTGAQRRALRDIAGDLSRSRPMHRLLQGDVGSGKTTVALVTMLAAVDGRHQSALLAPTEVLAEQHVASLRRDVAQLSVADANVLSGRRPVTVALLTGRVKGIDRKRIIQQLEAGAIDIVVGTHALLTDDVQFRSLGVVVIDEQHRFGVEQRASLRDKGRTHSVAQRDPDLLVMTATPIPRTAALVAFADLDLTVIDELPAGRTPIVTSWVRGADEHEVWDAVRAEVALGRRAFVVCPLVDGSERVEAASAVTERERLATGELAGLAVGLLHGQMKSAEKDAVMESFRRGEIEVLVATTVIEVGVDVPLATVMVIEDAWRFGIAQLHQLRGRVGRGEHASRCFLLGDPPTDDGVTRLEAVAASTDGFYLAEVDLEQRGEGTILGARQQGRSDLRLASLRRDGDILDDAREAAEILVNESAELTHYGELVDELKLFIDEDEAHYLFMS